MTESMTEKKIRTRKAVIIGAGRVGSHSALCLMFQHLVNEIVFLDVNEEAARAQALDLEDLASGLGDSFKIRVGDYSDCADAHFVILTAGRSRRPGETRLQMLDGTIKVLDGVIGPLRESGFHGILISVSNPADIVVEYPTATSVCRAVTSLARAPRLTPRACAGRCLASSTSTASRFRPSAWASTETPRSFPPRTSRSRASRCASTCRCSTPACTT